MKMTIMCGLPRSGKSTWVKKNAGQSVIICPDRIRKLIFGHQFHKNAEDYVWALSKSFCKLVLEQGKNVLIDATNMTFSSRNEWYKIAEEYNAKVRLVWIMTPLKFCLARNRKSKDDCKIPAEKLLCFAKFFQDPRRIECQKMEITKINEIKGWEKESGNEGYTNYYCYVDEK